MNLELREELDKEFVVLMTEIDTFIDQENPKKIFLNCWVHP